MRDGCGAFFDPDPVVDRKVVEFLHQPARPADRVARTGPFGSPSPKKTSLLCWERNPDPACSMRVCGRRPVSTVIAAPIASRLLLSAAQAESDGRRQVPHHILQKPQLRTIAILQKHFLPAVVIEVGEREGAAVFEKVEADRRPKYRKTFRPDCWRRRHCARSRSRCHRRGSVR